MERGVCTNRKQVIGDREMREIYAIINVCNWGSTGKIGKGLQSYLQQQGITAFLCHGRGKKAETEYDYRIDSLPEVYLHYAKERVLGGMCFGSKAATKRLISFLRSKKVTGVFLMNLHGYYLNEKLFFEFLAHDKISVVYLMVDEAPYLGNCTYSNGCSLFKQKCIGCRNIKGWQRALFGEVSHKAFLIKDKGYRNMKVTFVAPEFVVNNAQESPLTHGYKMVIVDEAIDINKNIPCDTKDLKERLGITESKFIIGCVAPYSYERKGVRYLVEAAKQFENDDRFVFVQVGYDIKDKSRLPANYIPIGYVANQSELVSYYSLFDLFVFPSLSDTMPNTCLEALSCGTPLLCFNVSGMPYIADDTVMTLVDPMDVGQMVDVIKRVQHKTNETIMKCRDYAVKRYDNQMYFGKLLNVMRNMS